MKENNEVLLSDGRTDEKLREVNILLSPQAYAYGIGEFEIAFIRKPGRIRNSDHLQTFWRKMKKYIIQRKSTGKYFRQVEEKQSVFVSNINSANLFDFISHAEVFASDKDFIVEVNVVTKIMPQKIVRR